MKNVNVQHETTKNSKYNNFKKAQNKKIQEERKKKLN